MAFRGETNVEAVSDHVAELRPQDLSACVIRRTIGAKVCVAIVATLGLLAMSVWNVPFTGHVLIDMWAAPQWKPTMQLTALEQPGMQGFTLVVQTYDRTHLTLLHLLHHYARCHHIAAVVVVDNHPKHYAVVLAAAGKLTLPVPVRVISEPTNSMNNRFKPRPGLITTGSIFFVDDDLLVQPEDVDFAFEVWLTHRMQLVGFLPRAQLTQPQSASARGSKLPQYRYLFGPLPDGRYSMILVGASFFARSYLDVYWDEAHTEMRSYVDRVFNCDDIGFNFVVARVAALPPVLVRAAVTSLVTPLGGISTGSALNKTANELWWGSRRSACLTDLNAIFEGSPLHWSNAAIVRDTTQMLSFEVFDDNTTQQSERAAGTSIKPSRAQRNGTAAH